MKKLLLAILTAALMVGSCSTTKDTAGFPAAGETKLPDTGQSSVYDTEGNPVSCGRY